VTDYEIFGPYLIALMMSLSAVCVFVWAVLAGAFHGADEAALNFYRAEVENGGIKERTGE
jgi:hypothetical protein